VLLLTADLLKAASDLAAELLADLAADCWNQRRHTTHSCTLGLVARLLGLVARLSGTCLAVHSDCESRSVDALIAAASPSFVVALCVAARPNFVDRV
jgi:hypothetical protein